MAKSERENQDPQFIGEWASSEINPQEIANALGGVLEESADDGFRQDIHLYYGEIKPVITLKCNPEDRSIFLGVNDASDETNKSYRSVTVLSDIEEIQFVDYLAAVPGGKKTTMLVRVKGSAISGMVVSSHATEAAF